MGESTVKMTTHKQIPKKIRQQVYEKYNGHCAYCGRKITLKEMQVDHVYSVYHAELNKKGKAVGVEDSKGDPKYLKEKAAHVNDIDNLMPACRQCNFYKGAMDIEAFRSQLETALFYNATNTFQFRLAERYGLVKPTPHHIEFYFEKEKSNDHENYA